jgi:glucokinase
MLLAGDIGGTTSRLGLFHVGASRPQAVHLRDYTTLEHRHLVDVIATFVRDASFAPTSLDAVCFGVAGPVTGGHAALTNVPWTVDAEELRRWMRGPRVSVINDLQATAMALPVLSPDEVHTLQTGQVDPSGPMAVIAAGTGLGEAILHRARDRWLPLATEAGHADFAPRSDDDVGLWRELRTQFGRAAVEHVVSGPGLTRLHQMTHATPCIASSAMLDSDLAAQTATSALNGTCRLCAEALSAFVDAYGAEAGNFALRTLPTGGLYIAGGIAPKILPALTDGRFMDAFLDKAPMTTVLARIPVHVVLHPHIGLLGAAVYAKDRC